MAFVDPELPPPLWRRAAALGTAACCLVVKVRRPIHFIARLLRIITAACALCAGCQAAVDACRAEHTLHNPPHSHVKPATNLTYAAVECPSAPLLDAGAGRPPVIQSMWMQQPADGASDKATPPAPDQVICFGRWLHVWPPACLVASGPRLMATRRAERACSAAADPCRPRHRWRRLERTRAMEVSRWVVRWAVAAVA